MLKNYLLVALRQIKKYRGFSAINVLGLAFSMSICLLILGLIDGQGNFDDFHPDADRIYRLTTTDETVWGKLSLATSSAPIGPELMRQNDSIESLVQMRRTGGQFVRDDGRLASWAGLYANSAFFDVFGFPLAFGNASSALDEPYEVVLSAKLASKLFPDRDPIGQTVTFQNVGTVTVTGVLKPMPETTHLRFDALVSFPTIPSLIANGSEIFLDSWNIHTGFYNYFKLKDGADAGAISLLANRLEEVHYAGQDYPAATHWMQPATGVNLGRSLSNQVASVVSSEFTIALSFLASILIFIAVINYVNLSTSRSLRRTQEIGIRKVVGAHRRQLVQQFVTEAVVTTFLALGVAILLLQWLIPAFNGLSSFQEQSPGLQVSGITPALMVKFVMFALALGLAAGLLPALRMSRFTTVRVLKGLTGSLGRRKITARKVMTVFQFSLSIVAIVLVITLFKQATYAVTADYGFDRAQMLHLELNGLDPEALSSRLELIPGIEHVSMASGVPSSGNTTQTDFKTQEMEEILAIQKFSVDQHFIDHFGIELLAGRNLSRERSADATTSILITENVLPMLGFETAEEALGMSIIYDTWSLDEPVSIVGVVSNFYSHGFEDGYVPVVLDAQADHFQYVSVRVAASKIPETLASIENVWAEIAPGLPATWTFFDDMLQSQYSEWLDSVRILGLFALFIVLIASLGLLGMTALAAEIRLREVSIRKVLGADVRQVVALLSGEYITLVAVAIAISAPVSYILARFLLSFSANHVELGPLTILFAVLPVLLLALATIGSQTIRAATANPIDVIRDE